MGVDIGSFKHDFLTMHCQSGMLVLFNAPGVQRGLEAAQPEGSGECGPWAVLGWDSQELCSESCPGCLMWDSAAHQPTRTGQQKHLGLQLFRACRSVSSSCAHMYLCVLDSFYKVWLLPCSVCGLWQDVPFGVSAVHNWREQIAAQSLCCAFKTFTGCYVDCECFRRQIGCSHVLVLLTFWVTFFLILQSLSISLHDMQNCLRCWRIMF